MGDELELPPLDLKGGEVKVDSLTLEIDQGKKRKNKLEDLLRRRRAPQSGSEGEDSDEFSSDEIFGSDIDEDINDTCLLDSFSEDELDVVIEVEEEAALLPTLSDIVDSADDTQLLPAIRLCCF